MDSNELLATDKKLSWFIYKDQYGEEFFIYTDKFGRKWKLIPVNNPAIESPFIIKPLPKEEK